MEPWKANLFDCYENIPATLLSFLCWPLGPCYLHLRAAKKAIKSCIAPYCILCYCGVVGCSINRYRIRKYHGIRGDCLSDFLIWCCCSCCASVQEFRETKIRARRNNKAASKGCEACDNSDDPDPVIIVYNNCESGICKNNNCIHDDNHKPKGSDSFSSENGSCGSCGSCGCCDDLDS